MGEDQKSPDILESLAIITDAMQTLFPDGKMICVYELKEEDYKKVQQNFRKIDHYHNKFSLDMSGLEHVFVLENTFDEPKEEPKKEIPKKSLGKKLLSLFKGGGSSV
jgi:hypothetical protein